MTTGSASHDAVLDRLTADLADVGRRLDRVREDLGTLRLGDEQPTPTGPAAPAPAPRPVRWPAPTPSPSASRPAAPQHPSPPPTTPPTPPPVAWTPPGPFGPPQREQTPTLSREGLGARLLAITGATVTLLGVVMLLVLAARNGWFGPPARVIGGAVLGLVLVGAGVRVHRRDASVGGVALAATGVAALYLDVAAASALYGYLPPWLALLAAAVVLAGGLVLADRWRHEGLALGVLVAGGLLAPVAAQDVSPLVVGLLVVAQLLVVPVVRRRAWGRVLLVVTALAGFEALVEILVALDDPATRRVGSAVAVLAVLVVAAGSAVITRERIAAGMRAATLVIPLPAVLALGALFERVPGTAIVGGVAVAALGLAAARRATDTPLAHAAAALAAVAGFVATLLALRGAPATAVLLGQAVVLAVVALRTTVRGPLLAAGVYGVVGLGLAFVHDVTLDALIAVPSVLVPSVGVRDVPALIGALVASVLLVAASMTVLAALVRLDLLVERGVALVTVAGLGLVGLYGATGSVVSAALLVSPTHTGFLVGHVLVTVSWTAVALVLLVRGLRDTASRALGGVLVVAAVIKLVLFDLVALDGLARVAAFLGAGIVLLVAGTRYARLVAAAPAGESLEGPSTAAATSETSSSCEGPSGTAGRQPEA